jgi:hypothetical protein
VWPVTFDSRPPLLIGAALLHLDPTLAIIPVAGPSVSYARTSIPALLLRHIGSPRPCPGWSVDRAYTSRMVIGESKSQGLRRCSVAIRRRSPLVFTDTGPRGTPAQRLTWGME